MSDRFLVDPGLVKARSLITGGICPLNIDGVKQNPSPAIAQAQPKGPTVKVEKPTASAGVSSIPPMGDYYRPPFHPERETMLRGHTDPARRGDYPPSKPQIPARPAYSPPPKPQNGAGLNAAQDLIWGQGSRGRLIQDPPPRPQPASDAGLNKALTEKVDALENKISTRLGTTEGLVASILPDVEIAKGELKESISTLGKDAETSTKRMAILEVGKTKTAAHISRIDGNVEKVANEVREVAARIERVAALKQEVAANKADQARMTTRLAGAESNAEALSKAVQTLTQQVGAEKEQVKALKVELGALKAAWIGVNASETGMKGEIEDLRRAFGEMQDKLSLLKRPETSLDALPGPAQGVTTPSPPAFKTSPAKLEPYDPYSQATLGALASSQPMKHVLVTPKALDNTKTSPHVSDDSKANFPTLDTPTSIPRRGRPPKRLRLSDLSNEESQPAAKVEQSDIANSRLRQQRRPSYRLVKPRKSSGVKRDSVSGSKLQEAEVVVAEDN